MWNHCRLICESLDLVKPSLILEVQNMAINGSTIAVELVQDLPTLIKIMEITHSKQEIRIAPHIKSAEVPTRITINDIRLYSQKQFQFMTFDDAEDEEDKNKLVSFYRKSIAKNRTVKGKQLQVISMKKIIRQLEQKGKTLSTQVKEATKKLELEKKEFQRLQKEQKKKYKGLQLKLEIAAIQSRRNYEALEFLRNRDINYIRNNYMELQAENVAYEIENVKKQKKIHQLVRQLRIQQVGGENRSFNQIQ